MSSGELLTFDRFIASRLGQRTASDLAKQAGLSVPAVTGHLAPGRRPMVTSPSAETCRAYARALPSRIHPLWDSLGRTLFGLDFDDASSLLLQQLASVVGTEALDEEPTLRAAIVSLVEESIALARRAR